MSSAPNKRVGKKRHYVQNDSPASKEVAVQTDFACHCHERTAQLKNHKISVCHPFSFGQRKDCENTGGQSSEQQDDPVPSTSGTQDDPSKYQFDLLAIGDLSVTEKDSFVTIEKKSISSCFNVDFKELCFWQLFYDLSNFEAAEKRAIECYKKGQLPGIKFISYPIRITDEIPLLFFSGPYSDVHFMTYIGHMLVSQMKHVKQMCNKSYDNFIYCRRKGEQYKIKVPF
jgi:hypothetical protein